MITEPDPPDLATRVLLRPHEAANALGISERTLWQLMNDGQIPAIKVGRQLRYSVDALRQWANGGES